MFMLVNMVALSLTIIMLYTAHPVMLIIMVIMYTITVGIMVSTQFTMFWYGYILIMVFLGGMLILFLYLTSLAPNEKLHRIKMLPLLTPLTLLIPLMLTTPTSTNLNYFSYNGPIMSSVSKLYGQSSTSCIFLVFYLLVTLLIVVKITNYFKGPIRSM